MLHCFNPKRQQQSHRKHTRYKYIHRKRRIGTRALTTHFILLASHRTAPPWSASNVPHPHNKIFVGAHQTQYNCWNYRIERLCPPLEDYAT